MSAKGKNQLGEKQSADAKFPGDSDLGEKPIIIDSFDTKAFLKNATSKPGVYRMLDVKAQVIYVGKAKNLKKTPQQLFPGNGTFGKDTGDGIKN